MAFKEPISKVFTPLFTKSGLGLGQSPKELRSLFGTFSLALTVPTFFVKKVGKKTL